MSGYTEHVAIGGVFDLLDVTYFQRASPLLKPTGLVADTGGKGISADNSDDEGTICSWGDAGRPLAEAGDFDYVRRQDAVSRVGIGQDLRG